MHIRILRWLAAVGAAAGLAACSMFSGGSGGVAALRVGVSPDVAPMAFKQNGKLAGIDIELAQHLGESLQRPVSFVELRWEDLIPALLDGRIDIIMSDMTITPARKVRIAFSEPYMQVGQTGLIRRGDALAYSSLDLLLMNGARIGFQVGTTAESFARQFDSRTILVPLRQPSDAAASLKNRRIDVFIADAPVIWWMISENESDLMAMRRPFTEESLGWGMRKEDAALQAQVNAALAKMQKDGALKAVCDRWLP